MNAVLIALAIVGGASLLIISGIFCNNLYELFERVDALEKLTMHEKQEFVYPIKDSKFFRCSKCTEILSEDDKRCPWCEGIVRWNDS